MLWLSGAHAIYAIPSGSVIQSDHFCVWKSNRKSFLEFAVRSIAARWRPSGDQRGLNMAVESGTGETWWVCKSIILMSDCDELPDGSPVEKTIRLPSGDQSGSP